MDLEAHKQKPVLFGILIVFVVILLALLAYQLFFAKRSEVAPPLTAAEERAERIRWAMQPPPLADLPPGEYEQRIKAAQQPPKQSTISKEEYERRKSSISEI